MVNIATFFLYISVKFFCISYLFPICLFIYQSVCPSVFQHQIYSDVVKYWCYILQVQYTPSWRRRRGRSWEVWLLRNVHRRPAEEFLGCSSWSFTHRDQCVKEYPLYEKVTTNPLFSNQFDLLFYCSGMLTKLIIVISWMGWLRNCLGLLMRHPSYHYQKFIIIINCVIFYSTYFRSLLSDKFKVSMKIQSLLRVLIWCGVHIVYFGS